MVTSAGEKNNMCGKIREIWERYADLLWEEGKHKDTCHSFIVEIEEIMKQEKFDQIDSNMISALCIAYRKKGNKNSTINRKLACLGKLLRKHHRCGLLDRLPDIPKFPENNARVRFLSREEEGHVFAAMDRVDARYGALCRFLVDTGARVGEAIGLRWTDIDVDVVTFWETKTNTPRSVPLTKRAMQVLEEQRGVEPTGPFRSIRYCNFRNAWVKAKGHAGLSDDRQVVPHVLRHTCASRLVQGGVDIRRIQEFLGHKTLAMTLRYAHLAPKHLTVCAETLDSFGADRERPSPPRYRGCEPEPCSAA